MGVPETEPLDDTNQSAPETVRVHPLTFSEGVNLQDVPTTPYWSGVPERVIVICFHTAYNVVVDP